MEQQADRRSVGVLGETLATALVERAGYRIVCRNYRWRGGEIDLVASTKRTTVFIEVRTRNGHEFGYPVETVGPEKLRRMHRSALHYVLNHSGKLNRLRIDVIGITLYDDRPPHIDWVQNVWS